MNKLSRVLLITCMIDIYVYLSCRQPFWQRLYMYMYIGKINVFVYSRFFRTNLLCTRLATERHELPMWFSVAISLYFMMNKDGNLKMNINVYNKLLRFQKHVHIAICKNPEISKQNFVTHIILQLLICLYMHIKSISRIWFWRGKPMRQLQPLNTRVHCMDNIFNIETVYTVCKCKTERNIRASNAYRELPSILYL